MKPLCNAEAKMSYDIQDLHNPNLRFGPGEKRYIRNKAQRARRRAIRSEIRSEILAQ